MTSLPDDPSSMDAKPQTDSVMDDYRKRHTVTGGLLGEAMSVTKHYSTPQAEAKHRRLKSANYASAMDAISKRLKKDVDARRNRILAKQPKALNFKSFDMNKAYTAKSMIIGRASSSREEVTGLLLEKDQTGHES